VTDQPSSLSQRADAQGRAKARRAKRIERREAFLDLVASGYSHRQIATAMSAALDRYYGLDDQPPLTLTHAAEPILPPLPSEVAQSGAQDVEIAHAPVDIAGSAGCDGDPPLTVTHAEPALPPRSSRVARFGAQDVEIARAPVDIARLVG